MGFTERLALKSTISVDDLHGIMKCHVVYLARFNNTDLLHLGPQGGRGTPEEIVAKLRQIDADNGPEFVAKAVQEWTAVVGAKTAYIERGSPWENGLLKVCAHIRRVAGCARPTGSAGPRWRNRQP
jgi:hypothetical protein